MKLIYSFILQNRQNNHSPQTENQSRKPGIYAIYGFPVRCSDGSIMQLQQEQPYVPGRKPHGRKQHPLQPYGYSLIILPCPPGYKEIRKKVLTNSTFFFFRYVNPGASLWGFQGLQIYSPTKFYATLLFRLCSKLYATYSYITLRSPCFHWRMFWREWRKRFTFGACPQYIILLRDLQVPLLS